MGVYTNNINNLSGLGSPPPDIYHQAVGSTMLSLLYKIAYDNNYLLLMEQGSERDKKALRYDLLLTKISQPAPGKYGDNILSLTSSKGGRFFSVKFKKDVSNLEFSNANKFYTTNEHNNETRINICAV